MSFLSLGEVVVPVGEVSTVIKKCISDRVFVYTNGTTDSNFYCNVFSHYLLK